MTIRQASDAPVAAPAADGVLYQPETADQRHIAVLFTHRWGGDYDDSFPAQLGPVLAGRGIATLSYRLQRYGTEGQFAATPEDDLSDLRQAAQYLTGAGYQQIILCGEGVGAVSLAGFLVAEPQESIKGLVCVRPAHPMGWSLTNMIGEERYQAAHAAAQRAVDAGKGSEEVIEIVRPPRNGRSATIRQLAGAWLRWWGGAPDTDLGELLRAVSVPVLVVGADAPWQAVLQSKAGANRDARFEPTREDPEVINVIAGWIDAVTSAGS